MNTAPSLTSPRRIRAPRGGFLAGLNRLIEKLRKYDPSMSVTQVRILSEIASAPSTTQSALIMTLGLKSSTSSRAVAALVQCGLVEMRCNSQDRRQRDLRITEVGREILSAAGAKIPAHHAITDRAADTMTLITEEELA